MSSIPISERLKAYNFYHVIEVEPGIYTQGFKQFQRIQRPVLDALSSIPLAGRRVLDIGCRDGLFCFHAENAGASEIIGIDNDLSRGAVDLLIPHLQSKVQMHQLNVMDLTPAHYGIFEFVIFAGVLYHLRFPMYALSRIRQVMSKEAVLLIETAVLTKYEELPLLYCPVNGDSPYEPTSVTFFNINGLSSTLRSLGIKILSYSLLDSGQPFVDRATLICVLDTALTDKTLDEYWTSTHRNHSSGDPKHRPPPLTMPSEAQHGSPIHTANAPPNSESDVVARAPHLR